MFARFSKVSIHSASRDIRDFVFSQSFEKRQSEFRKQQELGRRETLREAKGLELKPYVFY